jgi:hypothetical protein
MPDHNEHAEAIRRQIEAMGIPIQKLYGLPGVGEIIYYAAGKLEGIDNDHARTVSDIRHSAAESVVKLYKVLAQKLPEEKV